MTLPRPSLRQEQRRLTRRRIADAARECFYRDGVAATAVEHIARAAGVGRATLYLHFANKDAILLDLLRSNMRGVRLIFAELCDLDRADVAAVRAWLGNYVRAIAAHRQALRLFSVGLANDDAARTLVDDHRDAIVRTLGARYPALDAAPGSAAHARALFVIARVDHFAAGAVEQAPRFDVEAGYALVASEVAALLSGRPAE